MTTEYHYWEKWLGVGSWIAPTVLPAISPSLVHARAIKFCFAKFYIDVIMKSAKPLRQIVACRNIRSISFQAKQKQNLVKSKKGWIKKKHWLHTFHVNLPHIFHKDKTWQIYLWTGSSHSSASHSVDPGSRRPWCEGMTKYFVQARQNPQGTQNEQLRP